jgi:hypothetical protein
MTRPEKKFYRKAAVAARYAITPRTVDRMARDGRLPLPLYRGRWPHWDGDELDRFDRAVVAARDSNKAAA